ncbi:MAG: succinate dehydrogenase assembly factor 2 [Pseudomonadota bacterium]
MTEHEIRLKRLRIRAWRRGTKEMDLLLGGFADGAMATLDGAALDAFEELMNENDTDLYRWVSRQAPEPEGLAPALARLREFHRIA